MIFTSSYSDGDGFIADRELTGYTYKSEPVELWVTRWTEGSGREEYSAKIVRKNNNYDELLSIDFKNSLVTVLRWASKNLDGQPKVFGELDLLDLKRDASIKGEGSEYLIAAYLMLEFGYLASLASPNMPGYDIHVVNPKSKASCKLQVKFRSNRNSTFKVSSDDFDFLVLVDKSFHEHKKLNVSAENNSFKTKEIYRPIPSWPIWIIDKNHIVSDMKFYGYVKSPRYSDFYHNWKSISDFLS
ncbi:hypothetical protein QWI17_09330 [Gilvimarinus sp. SDUM040013]|uniref:PD(D/E)XK endonuclease domain-containing protein n=1 Tax=Gilvimarinus gilvus TaxID=3058038 RepID=A0ABU4S0D0_9GAMM|nr:hypothetical protein [Gilvimarinus sp. SDUM040013]MDO3386037.1 hypothetical protein [Gilvimarinus sp. SDUM040013]MDX6850490.1 hypothetical protein [Gilvimarinus sp. SDUM040013]